MKYITASCKQDLNYSTYYIKASQKQSYLYQRGKAPLQVALFLSKVSVQVINQR